MKQIKGMPLLEHVVRRVKSIPNIDQVVFATSNRRGNQEIIELSKKEFKYWLSCKVPFRFFNINWNGDVTPCIIDYDSKYTVGNVKESTVLDIWNNDKMQFFGDCHINKRFDVIRKNSKGVFCDYCSNFWCDPNDNGHQYPTSFEQGVRDYFNKETLKTRDFKTMAGNFLSDEFRTEEELIIIREQFLRDFDYLYETIINNS